MTDRARGPGTRYLLLGAVLFLTLSGLVMVFSAASATDYVEYGDTAYALKRQFAYVVAGGLIMGLLARIDYRRLRRYSWPFVLLANIALLAVLFVGTERGGSSRWLDLGPISLQPSEFAKIACVLALAAIMTDHRARNESVRLMRVSLVLPPVLLLVMLEPDMGTAMAILISSFLVLLLGGLSWGKILASAGVVAGFTAISIAAAPYRLERWLSFLDPWADPLGSGYQTIQAILAFASGGLTGVGLGMSRQKFSYLPEAHTDFILAVIGEELGLVGTLAVVAAFVVFTVAGFRIAIASKDRFGALLAAGITTMIVSQAVINMLAVTNLMPVTGIPLPFVSFGGNSILVAMAGVGIMLSVSRHAPQRARVPVRSQRGGRHAHTAERRRDRGAHLPRALRGGRTRVGRA